MAASRATLALISLGHQRNTNKYVLPSVVSQTAQGLLMLGYGRSATCVQIRSGLSLAKKNNIFRTFGLVHLFRSSGITQLYITLTGIRNNEHTIPSGYYPLIENMHFIRKKPYQTTRLGHYNTMYETSIQVADGFLDKLSLTARLVLSSRAVQCRSYLQCRISGNIHLLCPLNLR